MNDNFQQSCLLINKPPGISSNKVLTELKKKLNQKKAGFSGTLDPLASGLLIIFFNKATKLCSYFLDSDKKYEAIATLGKTSSTGDADGIIKDGSFIPNISINDLNELEKKFTGRISQIPPMYSALKYHGTPLYKYAREGITIDRKPRNIEIFKIEIKKINDINLSIKVHCSKGTYIRTLIEQIGEEIGCGAFLKKLVRTQIKDISLSKSVDFDKFLDIDSKDEVAKHLINIDMLLNNTYSCYIDELHKKKILNGNKVLIAENSRSFVKIYDKSSRFLGVGTINKNSELIPKKILI